jgi:hypothetical protein
MVGTPRKPQELHVEHSLTFADYRLHIAAVMPRTWFPTGGAIFV